MKPPLLRPLEGTVLGVDLEARRESRAMLTARERQITLLVARGLTNREIATELAISENTLRNQLHGIFRKLDVHNRLELVLYAISRHLLRPPQQLV